MSSTISFIAVRMRMMVKGTMVTNRPVGDTLGICCSSPMHRKKMLAYLRNCSYKNCGEDKDRMNHNFNI